MLQRLPANWLRQLAVPRSCRDPCTYYLAQIRRDLRTYYLAQIEWICARESRTIVALSLLQSCHSYRAVPFTELSRDSRFLSSSNASSNVSSNASSNASSNLHQMSHQIPHEMSHHHVFSQMSHHRLIKCLIKCFIKCHIIMFLVLLQWMRSFSRWDLDLSMVRRKLPHYNLYMVIYWYGCALESS